MEKKRGIRCEFESIQNMENLYEIVRFKYIFKNFYHNKLAVLGKFFFWKRLEIEIIKRLKI